MKKMSVRLGGRKREKKEREREKKKKRRDDNFKIRVKT